MSKYTGACNHKAVWVGDFHWAVRVNGIVQPGTLAEAIPDCPCPQCCASLKRPARPRCLQEDMTNFYISRRPESDWLPGKQDLVIDYTMTDETPRPDEDVLAAPIDQKWYATPLVNPGQIAHARVSSDGRLLTFLADILHGAPYAGYVTVSVLHRSGDVCTSMHCTECGAGEGDFHRGMEHCPGLKKMRRAVGLAHEPLDPTASAIGHVKETRLRPYKSELAVVMVDDQSEPP